MCAINIGYYFTGDGALRDEDNDYRITGRVDDMINCKGHRIGTAELECAMVKSLLSVSIQCHSDNVKGNSQGGKIHMGGGGGGARVKCTSTLSKDMYPKELCGEISVREEK